MALEEDKHCFIWLTRGTDDDEVNRNGQEEASVSMNDEVAPKWEKITFHSTRRRRRTLPLLCEFHFYVFGLPIKIPSQMW